MCSLDDYYWILQPLQQLRSGDLRDSSRQTRLQRRRQFCKPSTKERRDLQVKAKVGKGNKTISTVFTGVLLCRKCTNVFFMAALMGVVTTAEVYNMPVPMHLLHDSLLLDFTTAAAAEELLSRRQLYANSAAAAEAAWQGRCEERRD